MNVDPIGTPPWLGDIPAEARVAALRARHDVMLDRVLVDAILSAERWARFHGREEGKAELLAAQQADAEREQRVKERTSMPVEPKPWLRDCTAADRALALMPTVAAEGFQRRLAEAIDDAERRAVHAFRWPTKADRQKASLADDEPPKATPVDELEARLEHIRAQAIGPHADAVASGYRQGRADLAAAQALSAPALRLECIRLVAPHVLQCDADAMELVCRRADQLGRYVLTGELPQELKP